MTPEIRSLSLERMTDEELMAQFQQGIESAFNILVQRYRIRLEHYVFPFVRDEEEVKDILQETWMRLYRNRHSYTRIAKFSTWLYTIAGNLARSEYRKMKRRRAVCPHSRHIINRAGEEYEEEGFSVLSAPDKALEDILNQNDLLRALNTLTEEFRELVILRDFQHLPYAEIAEITGLPMGTVKSRINRGRTRIVAHLKLLHKDVR